MRFEGGVDIATQHHSLGLPGPQPSALHKEGVKLELWLPQDIAEGAPLREWTHTSKAVINSVNDLHTAWEAAVAADSIDDSQVPHVMVSIEAVKTKHGTFKKPVLTLKQFVPRPIDWTIKPIVAAAPSVPDTAPQMADAGAFGSAASASDFGSAAPPASDAKDDDLPF